MYMNKNKGWIMVEAVLSLAIISIVLLPVFSQSGFFLKFLHKKNLEQGEEKIYKGTLRGIGFSSETSEIEVEIERRLEESSYILITDREGGICR